MTGVIDLSENRYTLSNSSRRIVSSSINATIIYTVLELELLSKD